MSTPARTLADYRPRHLVAAVLFDLIADGRDADEVAALADALLDPAASIIAAHALRAALATLPRGEGGDA